VRIKARPKITLNKGRDMKTKKLLTGLVLGAAAALVLSACGGDKGKPNDKKVEGANGPVELTISCGSVGQDAEMCKKLTEQWAAKTGNKVKMFAVPPNTSDILALFRQQFSAKSAELDVVMVDVVWPGMIKNDLVDLTQAAKDVQKDHFPAIIANNTIDGKLLAMPWFTDAGLLYYRKDLLEKYQAKVPTTWEELTATAQKVQDGERASGNKNMNGYVFQGKATESLTCNALEWVSSYKDGGTIVDKTGKITINNPQAAKALDMAAGWIGTISPQGVLNYGEEDARGVFQNGDAVFMRNWPYAWALVNGSDPKQASKVKGNVGIVPLPKAGADGSSTATLGGWQLGVSQYSKNQAAAIDLVMYLTSKEVQKQRAIEGAYNPTIPALYTDADILTKNPFFKDLLQVFENAVARPSTATGEKYNEVSNAFWDSASSVISGKAKGAEALSKLEGDLDRVRQGEKW
jgi:trehalose/maltose transport system substrate-binding protein